MSKEKERDLECCGFSKVHKSGQIQIPVEARNAVGFGVGTPLMVFADRAARRLIVTLKPLDDELLELAAPRPKTRRKSI